MRTQERAPSRGVISQLDSAYQALLASGKIIEQWTPVNAASAVGPVASWPGDINGLALVQADAAKQPSLLLDGLNEAYPSVRFDGVDDSLRLATLTGFPTGATVGNVFMVGSRTALDDPSALESIAVSYGGTAAGTYRAVGKSAQVARAGDGITWSMSTGEKLWLPTVPGLIVGVFEATEYALRFNGLEVDRDTGATLNTGTASLTVGADNAGSPGNPFAGDIGTIVITSELTEDEMFYLEGWLALEYGVNSLLDPDHPFTTVFN